MNLAPQDRNSHGYVFVHIVLLFPIRRDCKFEMHHTVLGSRLGIMTRFDKGFLRVG